jgi:hypothetical protein
VLGVVRLGLERSAGRARSQPGEGRGVVREQPGITKAELKDAAGLSSAGVAQNLRRMLDAARCREEALPSGSTGYRLADRRTETSASGRVGQTSS